MSRPPPLETHDLRAGHGPREILRGLDLALPRGGFTVIVGPNACGKSTLLCTLARLHEPSGGSVLLDGRAIADFSHRERARRLAVLPQAAETPDGTLSPTWSPAAAIRMADFSSAGRPAMKPRSRMPWRRPA